MPPCVHLVYHFLQAWFAGEKVGEGTGRTRREAQRQAAEESIKHLASMFLFFWLYCCYSTHCVII